MAVSIMCLWVGKNYSLTPRPETNPMFIDALDYLLDNLALLFVGTLITAPALATIAGLLA